MVDGYAADGLGGVRDAFQANFDEDLELGAGFAVWLDGELVVDLRGGWADRARKTPWGPDTIVPVYSTTKGVAALVIAHLIDQAPGVSYETPVADLWPEFGAAGKDRVTLAELLSHQAGLPGFVEPIDPALWLDPPALAAALAPLPPLWTPGDGSGYHPLTWGYLAGEIAQRLAGRSLGTVLKEVFTNADGALPRREIIDFRIGTPPSEHARCADIKRPSALAELGELNEFKRAAFMTKWAAPDRGGAVWREVEIPSANGHGTAAAVARLYSIYAHGGRLRDREFISADTFAAFTKPRTIGPDRVLPFEMEFAAGVFRNNNLIYGPNPETLAHAGWGGSMAFGDPDRGLAAAYVMNRQSNKLQGDARPARLIDALYAALSGR
ncbi:MAG: serine hydrolase domain-containing protein [Pseudomonadota bacterium]